MVEFDRTGVIHVLDIVFHHRIRDDYWNVIETIRWEIVSRILREFVHNRKSFSVDYKYAKLIFSMMYSCFVRELLCFV